MLKLLNLRTSVFGYESVSNELISEFLQQLRADGMEHVTVTRDLSHEAIPHLDGEWLTALSTPAADRIEEQQAKVEFSNGLINELQDADLLVIGAPMYNFTIPSVLKAWLDHVARAGVTFKYTENGSVGLLENKKAIIMASMGGVHEAGKTDHLSPYLKTILGFLGINDVEIVFAQGLNMGAELRESSLLSAKSKIAEIASQFKHDVEVVAEEAA